MTGDEDDEEREDDPGRGDESEVRGSGGSFTDLARSLAITQEQMRETVEQVMAPIRETAADLAEVMGEYYEEVRTAVESTIDLDEPWEYDSAESSVHLRAERLAQDTTLELMEDLMEIEDPYFDPLLYRMRVGYEAYTGRVPDAEGEYVDVAPRPHEAIFVFISLQDALMHWLCEQDGSVEPDKRYPQRNVYHADTKQDAFEKVYTSYHGIAPDSLFFDNLDAFYHHRNYIMHGHPGAHFDENIATAAILFFILTLHTVMEELEDTE